MQPKIDMKIIEQRDTGKSSAQLHLYYMPKRYKSKNLAYQLGKEPLAPYTCQRSRECSTL
jgi:hypothetical protein